MEIDGDCIKISKDEHHLIKPEGMRQLMKLMMDKSKKPSDDESDKARQADADLHEEMKGSSKGVPVTKEDFPFDLGDEEESEEGSEVSDTEEDEDSEQVVPPKKKKKKGE